MDISLEQLVMVVLEEPAYLLDNKQARDIYGKLLNLKIRGYDTLNSKYLAVDETDLFATHFIVCANLNNELYPVISFKGVSVDLCKYWNIPFYGIEVIKQSKSESHIKAMERFIEHGKQKNINIGYTASLALEPKVKKNKMINIEALKMFESMVCRFHTDFDTKKSTCIGRIATNAPRVLKKVGYTPLSNEEGELSNIVIPKYKNEYQVLTLHEVSTEGLELMRQYEVHWENRLHFSKYENSLTQKDIYDHLNMNKKAS